MTLAEFLNEWLEMVVKPTRRHNTYRSYRNAVHHHIVPVLGDVALSSVTIWDVQRLVSALAAGHLSTGTVRLSVSVLSCGLHWAVRRGLIPLNPADGADVPAVEYSASRPLSRTEADAFLAATRGERLGALFALAILTGMRRGELLGLAWESVDLDAGMLTVERQLVLDTVPPRFGPPKTKAGRRPVPLGSLAVERLAEWRIRQEREWLQVNPRTRVDLGLVFTRPDGQPVARSDYIAALRRTFKAAGLAPRGGHQLRHTAASLWAEAGIHPRVVMAILGHSSVGPTMAIYTHVSAASLSQGGAAMDRLFDKQGPPELPIDKPL